MDLSQSAAQNLGTAESKMRILPHNTEAEQSLLGAIMLNNGCFENVSEFLLPIHFATPINGKIFEAIAKVIQKGEVADPITLRAYFEKNADLQSISGGEYLVQLVNSVVSIAGVENYGRLIHELYIRRQLMMLGENMAQQAANFDLNQNVEDQIEQAESKLYEFSVSNSKSTVQSFAKSLDSTLKIVEDTYKNDSKITGVTTGFIDLDKWLGGMNNSDLIILAARPSMGKTALATNIAFNAASAAMKKEDGAAKVAFFSLEMSSEQLVTRILAQECAIPSEKIRRGEIKEEDFVKIMEANKRLTELPFFIDDTPALTISALRSRARKLKRQHDINLIVVDYLQLLQGSVERRSRAGNVGNNEVSQSVSERVEPSCSGTFAIVASSRRSR